MLCRVLHTHLNTNPSTKITSDVPLRLYKSIVLKKKIQKKRTKSKSSMQKNVRESIEGKLVKNRFEPSLLKTRANRFTSTTNN